MLTNKQLEKVNEKNTYPILYLSVMNCIDAMSMPERAVFIGHLHSAVKEFYSTGCITIPDFDELTDLKDRRYVRFCFEQAISSWEADTKKWCASFHQSNNEKPKKRKTEEEIMRKFEDDEEVILPFVDDEKENAPSGKTRAEETIKSMSEKNHDLPGQMTIGEYFKNGGDE